MYLSPDGPQIVQIKKDERGVAYSTPAQMKNIWEFPDQISDLCLPKKDSDCDISYKSKWVMSFLCVHSWRTKYKLLRPTNWPSNMADVTVGDVQEESQQRYRSTHWTVLHTATIEGSTFCNAVLSKTSTGLIIQGIHKWMVRFQKLTRNLFLTL